jgi:hypothetical protein
MVFLLFFFFFFVELCWVLAQSFSEAVRLSE